MSSHHLALGLVFLGAALASAGAQEKPAPRATVKVPPEVVERVRAEVNDDADLQDCLQEESEEPVKIEELLSAEPIDLGAGHHAIVVRGSGDCLCSPTGNCDVWVYELVGGVPALLLRATAVQEVTLNESSTNGYRDLMTSMRSSSAGNDAELSVYKFDGKEYRQKECMRRTWTDAQGHRLKQPRLAPSSCEAQGKQ